MTLPVWATDPSSLLITEEEYEALPEEVTQTIEVYNGNVLFCESASPSHQTVSFNLTSALKAGRQKEPCVAVLQNTDMRYVKGKHDDGKSGPFTVRRPDISVLWCLEPGARQTSADVFVAIEITSSHSSATDFEQKKAEYAAQGIAVYMIVVMDGEKINSVEEYRLDWSGRNYQLVDVHRDRLNVELPENVKLNVTFDELEQI